MKPQVEKFKNWLEEQCPYPGELHDEWCSYYGNEIPMDFEPTEKDWENLMEYFISENFYTEEKDD